MFLLDTNVIDQLMKPNPNPRVIKWIQDCGHGNILYMSSIAKAEIEYGIYKMPKGKKREELAKTFARLFKAHFCYAFDSESASYYAQILITQRKLGLDINGANNKLDAMMAAIAMQHQLVFVTGDKDFAKIKNLKTINPWRHEQHKKP